MTPLTKIIAARIRNGGPITLAEYMETCLLHPDHGYYATRDPLGATVQPVGPEAGQRLPGAEGGQV